MKDRTVTKVVAFGVPTMLLSVGPLPALADGQPSADVPDQAAAPPRSTVETPQEPFSIQYDEGWIAQRHYNSPIIDIATGEVLPPLAETTITAEREMIIVPDVIDDAPITTGIGPATDEKVRSRSEATPGSSTSESEASASCTGSYFTPRGGSLIPPYDGKTIYWDAPGTGYEIRRLAGVECLGDAHDYQLNMDKVFKSSSLTQYGSQVIDTNGMQFEGCFQTGPGPWLCDFKVYGSSRRLTPQRDNSYARRVLVDWASYQGQFLMSCGVTIVGLWTGQRDLTDVTLDCQDYGPFNPY